ncbi:MAG: zinc-binding dehydrogenase [Armatimonadetes bacterium]|nr:zinc-binding dehydrogenase [Armatimonadota bacterium]
MKITRARVTAPQTVELEDAELNPRPDVVVIRNLACGICHSERQGWLHGPAGTEFIGLGHEPVGEIVELGADVKGPWHVGQRVSGYWGPGMAGYAVASPASLAPVPDSLPTDHAIGEVLACLVTCSRGWNHEFGADLCLVGCGFMGAVSVSGVRHSARNLIAVDLKPERLEFARRQGATHTVRADEDPVAQVREITEGRMCAVVGEATGVGAGLDLAVQLVGGFRPVINLISWLNHEVRLSNLARLDRGVVLRNPHPMYAPDRMEELRLGLSFAARGAWDLDDAISHYWPLAEVHQAYTVAMNAAEGYIKGVVRC